MTIFLFSPAGPARGRRHTVAYNVQNHDYIPYLTLKLCLNHGGRRHGGAEDERRGGHVRDGGGAASAERGDADQDRHEVRRRGGGGEHTRTHTAHIVVVAPITQPQLPRNPPTTATPLRAHTQLISSFDRCVWGEGVGESRLVEDECCIWPVIRSLCL